jgi:antitoxin MazE
MIIGNYRNYMKTTELHLTRIGNSKGIRLPSALLKKYGITSAVVLEERPNEIALRTKNDKKLSWSDTFAAMAQDEEDWSDFETTAADGIE